VDFENYVDFVDFVDLAELVQSMNPSVCAPVDLVSTTATMSAQALPTHFKLNNGTSIPVVGLGRRCPPCPVAD
jgi:hypothetical protein